MSPIFEGQGTYVLEGQAWSTRKGPAQGVFRVARTAEFHLAAKGQGQGARTRRPGVRKGGFELALGIFQGSPTKNFFRRPGGRGSESVDAAGQGDWGDGGETRGGITGRGVKRSYCPGRSAKGV